MKFVIVAFALLISACAHTGQSQPVNSADTSILLTHSVFFKLENDDEASILELTEACNKYLKPHEGIEYFAVGPRAIDKKRDVNDQNFDVALIIIFKDVASHDAYQTSEKHLKFIELYKDNWKNVRVFVGVS